MQKLPIGISTFQDIIDENCIYIDKTKIALNLIESGRYYFLSRPRRFGKSLFLSTLKAIFESKKELFKDLYIYDKYDWNKSYPVIHFTWGSGIIKDDVSFASVVRRNIELIKMDLGIVCNEDRDPKRCLEELITNAYNKYGEKVVILIDEYDKPILDNIENSEIAKVMRERLRDIYSLIKDNDRFLKFVFITGVSKFSKVSLFSGLNNIEDITLDKRFATITGYTQEDIETTFAEHLKGADFEKIKRWYNGYKWLGEGVYNPFDILLFISKGKVYDSYWFQTATPTFLLKVMEQNNYFLPNLEYVVKDSRMLNSFDVDYIELETLMWQTGYLTIDSTNEAFDGIEYKLTIPNQEVRVALLGSIADHISKIHNPRAKLNEIHKALLKSNLPSFKTHLISLYASIPYNLFTNNKLYKYEGYYVSVFYAYIKSMGLDIIGEDITNKGRIDITIKMANAIYIIEFKTDGNNALEQIKTKQYHQKYLSENLPIYLVGIEFDVKERNVRDVEWEMVLK